MALPCISWSLDVKPGRTLEVGHGGKLKANNGVCGYPGLQKQAYGSNSVQVSTIVLSKQTLAKQWRFMAKLIASMERMV
jgi:hypothetical protein